MTKGISGHRSFRASSPRPTTPTGIALAVVATLTVVGLWLNFAPTNLGGTTTYSVTVGISMKPLLRNNDFTLIQAETSYHVGEVVLYNSQVLHRPVLHRIILIQNGDYFFKGDNNRFVDPGYATRSELIGALWFAVPEVGAQINWLGTPLHAAFVAGAGSGLLMLASRTPPRRGRRRRRRRRVITPVIGS
jgi:signal peptidase I